VKATSLEWLRRHRTLAIFAGLIAIALGAVRVGFCFVPIPEALQRPTVQSIALVDRNGIPLREKRVEERFSRETRLAEVPPHVIAALLAAEDKRFRSHHGIDWLATGRGLFNGVRSGHFTSGASTITQQLIKISERRPRTVRTKIIESIQAVRLEQTWSKDQILAAYVNRLDFGNLNIGLAAAADYYLGKPIGDLSVAEAAFLAGLPKNPRKLNPHVAFEAARARQLTVLRRMQEGGALEAARAEIANAETLRVRPPRRLFRAAHFVDLVLQQPLTLAPPVVRTTLDLALNDAVTGIVRERLAQLREQNVHNAAAVVIDNASGDVLALVGSENYFAPGTGQVNGAWAKRSAGSTLKPFTYLLALERGETPASMVADVRTSFPAADGFYRPENYNRRCYGPVRYRTALASSLNISAVKVLLAAGGPSALWERLRQVGLTSLDRSADIYGLGLTLGNCEGRLLELTNAYACLARLGEFRPWRLVPETPAIVRSLSRKEFVWQIADMLSDNEARTLSFGMNSALRFEYPVACKTGTSTDFRDNWTIGFTPEFTVGVWVGNFDGAPMREVSGVTGAGPIFHAIMDHLHSTRGTSWYRAPPGIVECNVHPLTGKLLAADDSRALREKFLADRLPPVESSRDYDQEGKVRLGPEYAQWFQSGENGLADRATLATDAPLRITSPLPGSTYLVDPDIPSSRSIPLTVTGAGERISWKSDSLECVDERGRQIARASEGEHRIIVTDLDSGRRAETWVRIRSL
jgi:penicillin-binding protein 1C